MPRRPTVAGFYSGAGGLDLGFEQAGYEVVLANDLDPIAIRTHANIGKARLAVAKDVTELQLSEVLPSGADVVVGGPPCQGFSVAGKMDPHDPRSRHVWTFLSLVSQIKPRAFVMENVKNLYVNERWRSLRDGLAVASQMLGYSTRFLLLNASHFGVSQNRERMFLIGVRGDVHIPELSGPTSDTPPSVRDAISQLPSFGVSGNNTFCSAKISAAARPVLRKSPFAGMLFNGAGRPLDLERPSTTLPATMGGNRTPIIEQNVLEQRGESWIRWYHSHLLAGGSPLGFSDIVDANLRRLTVEEAAVLQGFPVGTRFEGGPSAQFRQIGNSVAPPVAHAVAELLLPLIDSAGSSCGSQEYDEDELIGLSLAKSLTQAEFWPDLDATELKSQELVSEVC